MKKVLAIFCVGFVLTACNNEGEVDSTVDSIEERKDTLLDNIDSTAQATIDSVKNWSERQAEKVDSATRVRKDSVKSN